MKVKRGSNGIAVHFLQPQCYRPSTHSTEGWMGPKARLNSRGNKIMEVPKTVFHAYIFLTTHILQNAFFCGRCKHITIHIQIHNLRKTVLFFQHCIYSYVSNKWDHLPLAWCLPCTHKYTLLHLTQHFTIYLNATF